MNAIKLSISAVALLLAVGLILLGQSPASGIEVFDVGSHEWPEGLRGTSGGFQYQAAAEQIEPAAPEVVLLTGGLALPEPSTIVLGSAAVTFLLTARRRVSLQAS